MKTFEICPVCHANAIHQDGRCSRCSAWKGEAPKVGALVWPAFFIPVRAAEQTGLSNERVNVQQS